MAVFAAAVIAFDALTKHVVSANVPLGASMPLVPGIACSHVRNTGAAFSSMQGQQALLNAAALLMVAGVAVCVREMDLPTPVCLCLSGVAAGGVSNMIDRIADGAVTDFIEPTFVDFAIFNVADCFIVVGTIVFVVYVLTAGR